MFCNQQMDFSLLITLCIEKKNIFYIISMIHSKYQNWCNNPTKNLFLIDKIAVLTTPKYLNKNQRIILLNLFNDY